jgi:hypothetical protein
VQNQITKKLCDSFFYNEKKFKLSLAVIQIQIKAHKVEENVLTTSE